MIDIQKTINLFGYNPNKYSKQSKKSVVRICDKCGREQIVDKRFGYNLCARCSKIDRKLTEEHKDNIRKAVSGEKHPNWGKKRPAKTCKKISESQMGRKPTLKTREKLSAAKLGIKLTEEHKNNISNGISGDKHWNWKGGISYDPYCEKFNNIKKKEVRDKYNNCDYLTGIHRDICNIVGGEIQELSVHHIDFNKQQGCNDIPWKLISVSRRHNTMFNKDRPFWKRLILYALEYDKEYYKDQN